MDNYNVEKVMKKNKIKQGGFTLIEIMIVVVIIGILASVIAPRIFDKPGQARTTKAAFDIKTISSALDLYRLDTFDYPGSLQQLEGKYLKKLQKDPWGRDYIYLSSDDNYQLYSYGKDGVAGGSGENADIRQ